MKSSKILIKWRIYCEEESYCMEWKQSLAMKKKENYCSNRAAHSKKQTKLKKNWSLEFAISFFSCVYLNCYIDCKSAMHFSISYCNPFVLFRSIASSSSWFIQTSKTQNENN